MDPLRRSQTHRNGFPLAAAGEGDPGAGNSSPSASAARLQELELLRIQLRQERASVDTELAELRREERRRRASQPCSRCGLAEV